MACRYIQGSFVCVISVGSGMEIFINVSGCFRKPTEPKEISSIPSHLAFMPFCQE